MPRGGRDRLAGRRSVSVLALTLATYVLLLVAGSALHHDLVCHPKSRAQCSACAAGASDLGLASERQTVEIDRTWALDVQADSDSCPAPISHGPSSGRAPPA